VFTDEEIAMFTDVKLLRALARSTRLLNIVSNCMLVVSGFVFIYCGYLFSISIFKR